MKKLMIAAALAAAFVGAASAEETDCAKCVWGYKLQLVAKTTVAANVSNYYAKACNCYRKPTVGKLVGYVFGVAASAEGDVPTACGGKLCKCNNWGSNNTEMRILLWKAWNGAAYYTDGGAIVQVDRIGYKDRSTAEMLWTISPRDPAGATSGDDAATLYLGGFGKCAHRADGSVAIKNANGFFAGQMYSYCQDSLEDRCGGVMPTEPYVSHCWALCEDDETPEIDDQNLTVACGKWQMVWDSQLVERFHKQGISPATARPSIKYDLQDWSVTE